MASRTDPKKDVVIIGLGWTGSILGMELAQEGLNILALERGEDRNTVPDFQYPEAFDELKYGIRYGLMQKPAKSTLTIRHTTDQVALPYRHLGAFLPGDGVGGAGVHWNGQTWRQMEVELRLKSYVEENFGAKIIPEGMQLQDWGVTAAELDPFHAKFERVAGIAGKAGNLNGKIQEGGNPFEAPRSTDYPMPPMKNTWDSELFAETARKMGYHPFPRPSGHASVPYVNDYGMQMGPCNYCGFCERYGCNNYSKSSPQVCVLDALKRMPNFSYKVNSEVLKIEKSPDGKTASGVTYIDGKTGEEVFQPADLVLVCAFSLHNVHLLLLSQIGQPYDPATGEGVIGRNYSYQVTGGTSMWFRDKVFNPFVGTGSAGMSMDDFSIGQIDFAKEGFIGGSYITGAHTGGRPIEQMSLPPGTASWGGGWKQAVHDWYGHNMSIATHGSNMAYRDTYLDLDPTYKDRYGRPLMRMTFDWKDNDIRMTQFMRGKIEEMAKAMSPDFMASGYKKPGDHFDVTAYQSTHNVGGAIMGTDPRTSALNRYLQSWDCHNVWVMGASAFPQNTQYNPTGPLGGLAYWAAHALRTDYLKNPRALM
ncbi:GMC family oxidoreductase [Aestuariivirga sp.]|uniref:GMC family oxidoreductase n=1 Tax=Aestuariivirga sp. TaxID=2650926 RepID=UPI0039E49FF3